MTAPAAVPIGAGEASVGPLLSVRGLSVVTGAAEAPRTLVSGVDFELDRGETLGIVGESGSGKTLTARSLLAVLPQGVRASGGIVFDGMPIIGTSERQLRAIRGSRICMVLQDPFTALNPVQTIGAHIRESLRPEARRSRDEARREVARRLEEVGLDAGAVADRYPFQLSGGMRQRVAIAAALASDPGLLVADEPTTALDVTTQSEVLALLKTLQADRGMALVLITHDLRVASTVCDQMLVMYAGQVVEKGPTAGLLTTPEHPYTAGLLASDPPVSHAVKHLVSIPGSVPAAAAVLTTCPFAARCDWREDACMSGRPDLAEVSPGRRTACVRIEQIRPQIRARQEQAAAPAPPADRSGSEPLLAVSNLVKTYRTKLLVGRPQLAYAVRGVSFEVGPGESVGVVGETGSGKTTIARCILGLEAPTSGSIVLGGIDISDHGKLTRGQRRAVSRSVQVVFQDPYSALNPMLTIGSALREALSVRGGAVDYGRETQELLTMVGLPAAYAGRLPKALSGGERQRAAIARALAVRPRLLICDEPAAALDVSVQAQILEVLRGVARAQGTSMLFITHDLALVRQMTDRALVLRNGEIVEQGPTSAVLDTPQHPYTIRLIASMPAADREPETEGEAATW